MLAVHTMARLRFGKGDVAYLCKPFSYVTRLLGTDAKTLSVREKDVLDVGILLFGGGTQFFSFPLTCANGRTFAKRLSNAICHPSLLPLRMFRTFRKQHRKYMPDKWGAMAAVGIGVGPFVEGSIEEEKTRTLFAKMDLVAVRDIRSYELCQRWGVKASPYTDLCFWPGFHAPLIRDMDSVKKSSIDRIGVIVRDWHHDEKGDSYYHSVMAVAEELAKEGKAVDFILFAGNRDRIWKRRLEAYRCTTVRWEPDQGSIAEFIQTLGKYDLFITARYHGAVFATLLCKPTICIAIEQKLEMYSNILGAGGNCWRYPFNASECSRMVSEIEEKYARAADCVRIVKQQQSALAERMVNEFREFAAAKMRPAPDPA
jgi:hypothetical protein